MDGLSGSLGAPQSGLAKRARMVLLAADGMPNAEIGRVTGVSRPTVIGWRDRYARGGIPALDDEPRSGRPPEIDEADAVVATLADGGRPPARLGITSLVGPVPGRRAGDLVGVRSPGSGGSGRSQPHRIETFKFSTDPGTGNQGPRCHQAVPGAARQRGRGQHR